MLYVMLNITLIQKHYLLAKVASTLLAFGLALIYSRQLGVENRSIVGYIFVLTSFIWIVLTSGTTLTLRKIDPDNQHKFLASFFSSPKAILLITVLSTPLWLFISWHTCTMRSSDDPIDGYGEFVASTTKW